MPQAADQLAIAARHPMAGNHRHQSWRLGAGTHHRARRANAPDQLTVADGVPFGNIAQRLPLAAEKPCRWYQRQAQINAGRAIQPTTCATRAS